MCGYVLGYVLSVFIAIPVTLCWSRFMHHQASRIRREWGVDKDAGRVERFPILIGVLERAIITTLVAYDISGGFAFVGAWVLAKSAGGWQQWSKGTTYGRATLSAGLLGSAMSILFAVVGGLIAKSLATPGQP